MSSSFEFPSQPWLLWVRVGFSTGKEKTAPESPEVWEREMKETSRTNTSVAEDISKVPEYKYLYKINQSTKEEMRSPVKCERSQHYERWCADVLDRITVWIYPKISHPCWQHWFPRMHNSSSPSVRHKNEGWHYLGNEELSEIRWCRNDLIFDGVSDFPKPRKG